MASQMSLKAVIITGSTVVALKSEINFSLDPYGEFSDPDLGPHGEFPDQYNNNSYGSASLFMINILVYTVSNCAHLYS